MQEKDFIGNRFDEVHIVFDDKQDFPLLLQCLDDGGQLLAEDGVHTGRGLVQQQDRGAAGQTAGQVQQFLLSIGDFTRLAAGDVFDEAVRQEGVGLEGVVDLFPIDTLVGQEGVPPLLPPLVREGQEDIFLDREVADQAHVLEGPADTRPLPTEGLEAVDGLAVQMDLAGILPDETGDDVEQGGLSGAVRAHQHGDGSARHLEGNVFQHLMVAVLLRDMFDCQLQSKVDGYFSPGRAGFLSNNKCTHFPSIYQDITEIWKYQPLTIIQ